jgi:hypothetical protein
VGSTVLAWRLVVGAPARRAAAPQQTAAPTAVTMAPAPTAALRAPELPASEPPAPAPGQPAPAPGPPARAPGPPARAPTPAAAAPGAPESRKLDLPRPTIRTPAPSAGSSGPAIVARSGPATPPDPEAAEEEEMPETQPVPDLSKLPASLRYSPERALATFESFCGIPVDPAKPEPRTRQPVADWGRVTRREVVRARVGGRDDLLIAYEVQGARGIYRFNGMQRSQSIGILDVPAGGWVALCESDRSTLYKMPPSWSFPMSALEGMLALTAPPRVGEIAHLAPIHTEDVALERAGISGKLSLDAARRYLVHATVKAADGARWKMRQWWIDVPAGIPGAALVAAGRSLWFVIERPVFEPQADGTRAHLVVRAAAILDELFPQ